MEDLYETIRAHDLRELLRARGVTVDPSGKTAAAWRNERTPSVQIYADHWRDYGADEGGDLLDWLERAEGMSKEAAREEAARMVSFRSDDRPRTDRQSTAVSSDNKPYRKSNSEQPATPSGVHELVTRAHEALVRGESEVARSARVYFEGRGLGGLIGELCLGVVDESVRVPGAGGRFRGRAVIPTFEGDQAVWFKARDLSGRSADELKAAGVNKYDGPAGSVPAPFNPAGLERARTQGFVVLTEGETDAASLMAAYGLEYPVVGLPGGNLPKGWEERLAAAGVPVYLAMDPDDAGAGKAERLVKELSGLGVRCYRLRLGADLNELLVEHGGGFVTLFNNLLENATFESTSDLLYIREGLLAELDARANRPHAAYTTGLEPLDALLNGGYAEGLHLLGGITGGGKTSFALQVAIHNAAAGRPVIFASYEQSRLELWGRIAARLTSVPYTAIKRGTYDDHGQKLRTSSVLRSDESWGKLEAVARHLKVVEGGDALSRSASAYTVEVLAKTAEAIAEAHGAPPLIVVDYLQRVPAPPELRIKDVRERVGYVAGLLQVHLARGVGCPVLALSSIGRAAYRLQEATLEERLAAFKEAGELEYTAYTAILLYGLSDELQGRLNLSPGMMSTFKPMTLDLVKNREGGVGSVGVQWYAERGAWQGAQPVGRRS